MKINKIQKVIVGIIPSIIIWFIGYGIAYEIYGSQRLKYTWWCWAIVFLLIGIFEFFWFRDFNPNKEKISGSQLVEKTSDTSQREQKNDRVEKGKIAKSEIEQRENHKSYLKVRDQYVKLMNKQRYILESNYKINS